MKFPRTAFECHIFTNSIRAFLISAFIIFFIIVTIKSYCFVDLSGIEGVALEVERRKDEALERNKDSQSLYDCGSDHDHSSEPSGTMDKGHD